MIRTSRTLLSLALLAIACSPRIAPVDGPATGADEDPRPRSANTFDYEPALAKLSSHLLEARRLAAEGKSAEEILAAVPLLEIRDGRVLVEVALERLTPEILERLRQAGLEAQSHSLEYARAYGGVALDRLHEVAALAEVVTIRSQPAAGTRRSRPGPTPP